MPTAAGIAPLQQTLTAVLASEPGAINVLAARTGRRHA
jgi:hypothetical protein